VIVTGFSFNTNGNTDYYTARYAAADGMLLWEQRHNGPANGNDGAAAVSVDASGNVVVTGYSIASGGDADCYTAKYGATNGALLWEKRYDGATHGEDYAASVATGPNGVIVITGSSVAGNGLSDFATIVYWEELPAISVALDSGAIRLRIVGVPGSNYSVDRAPVPNGPWNSIATPITPASGLIEYMDITAPPGSGFYRTSTPLKK